MRARGRSPQGTSTLSQWEEPTLSHGASPLYRSNPGAHNRSGGSRMSARTAKTITGSVWALTVGLVAGAITLIILNRSTVDANTASFYPLIWLSALSFVTVGSLIARRHPDNAIGWLFCVMGVGLAGLTFGQEYAIRGLSTAPGSLPLANWVGYETDLLFVPAVGPIGLVFLLFPNGRALSRKWRALVWILSAALVVSTLINVFDPHTSNGINDRLSEHAGMIRNPIGISALKGVLEATLKTAGFVIVLASLAAVVSLIIRLRRASGVERQQVRWLAYTGAAPGPASSRTGSSTGSEPRPTRSSRSSPTGWRRATRPKTCCRGWPRSWAREPEHSALVCGCGWGRRRDWRPPGQLSMGTKRGRSPLPSTTSTAFP